MKDNNQLLTEYLTFLEKVRNLSYLSIDRNKHVCLHWMEFLKQRGKKDVAWDNPRMCWHGLSFARARELLLTRQFHGSCAFCAPFTTFW